MNLQEMLINPTDRKGLPWFPYAGVTRFRFSGYDLSLLLQAPPTLGLLFKPKIRPAMLMVNIFRKPATLNRPFLFFN